VAEFNISAGNNQDSGKPSQSAFCFFPPLPQPWSRGIFSFSCQPLVVFSCKIAKREFRFFRTVIDEFVKTENNHREHKAHRDNLLKIKIFSL
jgi:hypothetical protein